MQATVKLFKRRNATVFLNNVEYTGFLIGSLPSRFAYINHETKESEGISSWFNYKGWTFIRKDDLQTGW
jgi:hypothetical protein